MIYRRGIKKQVRPLERLKSKYKDFQARASDPSSTLPSSQAATKSSSSGNPVEDALRKNPLKKRAPVAASSSSRSSPDSMVNLVSTSSTAASRYALMMAPPAPDKRPEKLRFNLNLLFSDGMEYSIQEARARSMGLLGKKWGPPPAAKTMYTASSTQIDDGIQSTKNMTRRKGMMAGAEPTVTINTKEALADVFGMYNSPEKTKILPGSKHAPVRKVEPVTPIVPPRLTFTRENENVNPQTSCESQSESIYLKSHLTSIASQSVHLLTRMCNQTMLLLQPKYVCTFFAFSPCLKSSSSRLSWILMLERHRQQRHVQF